MPTSSRFHPASALHRAAAALVPLLALLAPLASAQSILFQEGFENGLPNWAATGMWHVDLDSSPCLAPCAPFPEGGAAAWYGRTSTCNFDDGNANEGQLILTTWVSIPANVASASLYFQQWIDSEYCWGGWDNCALIVHAQNGPNQGFTEALCSWSGPIDSLLSWHERRVDLTAYRGAQVRFTFSFWTGDNSLNGGRGWLVDNVRIVTEPGQSICPSAHANSGCPCHLQVGVGGGCFNALTKSATLTSDGVASVSQDSLAFKAAEMPPGTGATLFQASASSAPMAFGDGLLCVTGSLVRLGTRFAPTGAIGWPVPNTITLSAAGLVSPAGGEYFYQVIYRDSTPTHCTAATFNLTSAQKVVWTP